jgi:hypothetical protein
MSDLIDRDVDEIAGTTDGTAAKGMDGTVAT